MNGQNAPTLNPAVFEVIGRENPQAVASLRDLGEGVRKFWGTYSIGLTIADDQTVKAMGVSPTC